MQPQLLLEAPPVDEAGEEIMIDQIRKVLLELLARGDVLHLGDEIQGLVLVVADERDRQQHPGVVAPAMAVAPLDLIAPDLSRKQSQHVLGVEIDVVGMRDVLQRRRSQLL
ncbi:MAG: hypothetical protein ABSB24_06840 [Gaiellaceae bacterium]